MDRMPPGPNPFSPGKLHPNWQPQTKRIQPPRQKKAHRPPHLKSSPSPSTSPINVDTYNPTFSFTPSNTKTMPSLTTDGTSASPNTQNTSTSGSTSPTRPPYSPITPTLSSARLITSSSTNPANSSKNPQARYTHAQPPQTSIPQPKPIPIVPFDENPDVLALKSAASILQMQARNAVRDIQALQRIKERAVKDPVGFVKALESGAIRTKGDPLYNPGEDGDEDDEERAGKGAKVKGGEKGGEGKEEKWEALPTPQNVVRCPPINWNQYGVVGDSLEKLHKDQVERPIEGVPQKMGSNGVLVSGGEGVRRAADLGVAAPYQPGRDKIEKEKMGTRKGGKR